ncbi:hypothetical protein C1646_769520 [Rhizophagus diaphanus]|nr:hypothetical protein C1646_769520 [Rhizophagus diaphanus] [Rhizophagus sp. MUCL 43196]
MSQLLADCLNDIFEFLDDTFTLHSCILVNRLWCEVSVRIAWRNSEIVILTPTTRFPTFNYASFCKVLSIREIYYYLELLLRNQKSISSQNLNVSINIIAEEILKLL